MELQGAAHGTPTPGPVALEQVFGPPLVLWPTERPWEALGREVREAREAEERGDEHESALRSARSLRGASSSAGPTHTLLRPAYGLLSSPGRHQKRVRIFLRWRKVVAELGRPLVLHVLKGGPRDDAEGFFAGDVRFGACRVQMSGWVAIHRQTSVFLYSFVAESTT